MEPKGSYERGYKDGYAKNVFDRERLTTELAQVKEQLREAQTLPLNYNQVVHQTMQDEIGAWRQRAESAEAKARELTAQVAVLVKVINESAVEALNEEGYWETADKLEQVISNLPAETEKLTRLVEAAEEHEEQNNKPWDGCSCPICKAVRDLRGGK